MCRNKYQWFLNHGLWFWTECGFFIWVLKDVFYIVLILMGTSLCSELYLSLHSNECLVDFYSKLILSCPFSSWQNEGLVFSFLYQLALFLVSWLLYGTSQEKESLDFCSHKSLHKSGDVSVETFSLVLIPWSGQMLPMLKGGLVTFPSQGEI